MTLKVVLGNPLVLTKRKNQHKTHEKEKKVQMTKIKGFEMVSYYWLYFGQPKHCWAYLNDP